MYDMSAYIAQGPDKPELIAGFSREPAFLHSPPQQANQSEETAPVRFSFPRTNFLIEFCFRVFPSNLIRASRAMASASNLVAFEFISQLIANI